MTEQPLPPGNVDAPAGASAERIKRRQYLLLLFFRIGVLTNVPQGEGDILRRLRQPRREIGERLLGHEIIVPQHARDALGDDVGREHLGQR